MICLFISVVLLAIGLLAVFLLILTAFGFHNRAKQSIQAANIAEAEVARLAGAYEALRTCYEHMGEIAREAISTAHREHFPAQVESQRTPNFITVDCRKCSAPVARVREEFPVNCPVCGTEVDPVLDADCLD